MKTIRRSDVIGLPEDHCRNNRKIHVKDCCLISPNFLNFLLFIDALSTECVTMLQEQNYYQSRIAEYGM